MEIFVYGDAAAIKKYPGFEKHFNGRRIYDIKWSQLRSWFDRGLMSIKPTGLFAESNSIYVVNHVDKQVPIWAQNVPCIWNEDELFEYINDLEQESEATPITEKPAGVESVTKMSYYNQGSIECIEAIKAALTQEEFIGWLRGTIIKYQWRLGGKNSAVEDSNKTLYYLNRLVKELQEMGLE